MFRFIRQSARPRFRFHKYRLLVEQLDTRELLAVSLFNSAAAPVVSLVAPANNTNGQQTTAPAQANIGENGSTIAGTTPAGQTVGNTVGVGSGPFPFGQVGLISPIGTPLDNLGNGQFAPGNGPVSQFTDMSLQSLSPLQILALSTSPGGVGYLGTIPNPYTSSAVAGTPQGYFLFGNEQTLQEGFLADIPSGSQQSPSLGQSKQDREDTDFAPIATHPDEEPDRDESWVVQQRANEQAVVDYWAQNPDSGLADEVLFATAA